MRLSTGIDQLERENAHLKLLTKMLLIIVATLVALVVIMWDKPPAMVERTSHGLEIVRPTEFALDEANTKTAITFMIKARFVELSTRELQQIRHYHYDPVKHLNWLTPRLKDAIQKNDIATVQALQAELRNIELTVVAQAKDVTSTNAPTPAPPSQVKRRKRSNTDAETPLETASMKDLQDQIPEG